MKLTDLLMVSALAMVVLALLRLRRSRLPIAQARAELAAGEAVLVDVREPAEWAGGVAPGAERLPWSDLRGARQRWAPFLDRNRRRKLLLYCQSGARSALAASQLRREGFDAVNAGAVGAWLSPQDKN